MEIESAPKVDARCDHCGKRTDGGPGVFVEGYAFHALCSVYAACEFHKAVCDASLDAVEGVSEVRDWPANDH